MMDINAKIYVAGHTGLLGTALVNTLEQRGYTAIIKRTHRELDLRNQQAVNNFFASEQPDYVFLAAARVGGIGANITFPAEFIYDNLMIQTNVIHAAYQHNVRKLLYVGSSCIYPACAQQPITEDSLLTGPLESSNESYAVAKIAGIKLCQAYNKQYKTNFISCMATNMYGPNDLFDAENSHVIPALIKKIHDAHTMSAPMIELWGSGKPLREFMYVDDSASALVFLMNTYTDTHIINVGTGHDVPIASLASMVAQIIGYKGIIYFNASKPDGVARKLLDTTRINALGWHSRISLQIGLEKTIAWYLQHHAHQQNIIPQKGKTHDL